MICAWIETSSADTGSSATIRLLADGERARDRNALALAAGELVRVLATVAGGEAHPLQERRDLLRQFRGRQAAVRLDRLRDHVMHGSYAG